MSLVSKIERLFAIGRTRKVRDPRRKSNTQKRKPGHFPRTRRHKNMSKKRRMKGG